MTKPLRRDRRGRRVYRKVFEFNEDDIKLLQRAREKFGAASDVETLRRLLRESEAR